MLPLGAVCLALCVYMLVHALIGVNLVGCGVGSSCDSVMGSPWAFLFGRIPVSAIAVVTYLMLMVCLLFLDSGKEADLSLDCIIWTIMLSIGGAIVGIALWFSYLQLAVLHTFCKYCCLVHFLGCVCGCSVYMVTPQRRGWKYIPLAAGFVAAGLMAFVQVKTVPAIVYDEGSTQAALPSFENDGMPVVGPENAEFTVTLMYDYQCVHCRKLHKILSEVIEKSAGKLKFILCPVSLSNECNPYVPDGIDRFAGSCTMARLGLAAWFSFPEYYPQIEEYLLGGEDVHKTLKPEDAVEYVREIVGDEPLGIALNDPRIKNCLSKAYELFGRTSNSEKSGIPRLILGNRWIVPETESADDLLSVIQSSLID